jgi:hypothetical protein
VHVTHSWEGLKKIKIQSNPKLLTLLLADLAAIENLVGFSAYFPASTPAINLRDGPHRIL